MAGESSYWWQYRLAEWRHSPCLMKPVTLGMVITMIIFWVVTMALTIPTWLLGFLMAPLMARGTWLIEFLYPMPIARWGHLLILRWSQPKMLLSDKAANYHSRTLEQRVEVVKGRVFVHPIPQLLDNLGYLVVCLPATSSKPITFTSNTVQTLLGTVSVTTQQEPNPNSLPKPPIVGFLVDCGDADTVREQVNLIRCAHYLDYPQFRIQMILSTHKHHDHTAGNEVWKAHPKVGRHLNFIVGGAVEKVPGCNMPVADGDRLQLPQCGENDMNEVAYVEVVAVPAHTRGSVVYLLRPKNKSSSTTTNAQSPPPPPPPCFAFTGDTMFCGGGGVPFEAGSDAEIDQGTYRDNAHGAIRAGVGTHAVERCFAEILVRGMPESTTPTAYYSFGDSTLLQNQFLVFPGHEYTTELLMRQFGGVAGGSRYDANKWKNFSPDVFFQTVSELYVALHRRSLPQATGKVLAAAPTTLRKELAINPHLRSLARRAELVVHAIRLWDAYFSKPKDPKDEEAAVMRVRKERAKAQESESRSTVISSRRRPSDKTPATEDSWNMDSHDAARSVFTTLFTSDLDELISDLASGKIEPKEAALQLEGLKAKLKEPVIRRRPIPGTLPSERVVFKGLVGFALLGSRPSAMTLSDSQTMRLPPPIVRDTTCILISKKRLIAMLGHLGYLPDSADGQNLLSMINSLWQEAHDYKSGKTSGTASSSDDPTYNTVGKAEDDNETSSSHEDEMNDTYDLIELGTLKWILYGFPARQPSWWPQFCSPCGLTESEKSLEKRQNRKAQEEHPVKLSAMKRRHGELVRHDVLACKLCRDATGCQAFEEDQQESHDYESSSSSAESSEDRSYMTGILSSPKKPASLRAAPIADDDSYVDTSKDSCVEVSTITSLLHGELLLEKSEEKVRL